ncbi:MAG TPA: hypothetical protein VLT32_16600 [Candidatus Sulfomarinibacteraceae bacterium]|nr:hypothetical protein [Candidatus Sulfomarinibacteraceae bacterium]
MLRATPLALVVWLVAAPSAAQPTVKVVSVYDGHATFELPLDWREVPPYELENATLWAAEASGGRLVEIYQNGFRPTAAADDHGLPQLMIQIRESGRLRSGDLERLPPLDELRERAREIFPAAAPPVVVGLDLERIAFDRQRHVVRMEHRLDLRLRGEVRVLTAAFLTERGWLVFHLSERGQRLDAARRLFERIVDSVRLDPAVAYRPRLADRWPGWPFFAAAALTAALLIGWLVLRRRPTP